MIKRRQSKSFTDEPSQSRAICSHCKDEFDTIVKIEPYYMEDGRPDSKFRRCPLCKRVIPIALTRYTHIDNQPLGWKGNGPVSFEIAEKSRRRRIRHRDEGFTSTEEPVPKFGNFEDKELKSMVANGAIVLSIQDDNVDVDSEEVY